MSLKSSLAFGAGLFLASLGAAAAPPKAGFVERAVLDGSPSEVVLERDGKTSGEFLFVGADGQLITIRKVLGNVGGQTPDPIPRYSDEFWNELLKTDHDILAEKLLSETKSDPTFSQIQRLYPPLARAEAGIGRIEDPSEVSVAVDGSIAMDSGYFSGAESLADRVHSPFLRFRLNDRLVTQGEYETAICRGLLNGWLPATETTYRQADTQTGWEELAFAGLYAGKPAVFVRFRVANLGRTPRTVEFGLDGPAMGGSLDLGGDHVVVVTPLRYGKKGEDFEYPPLRRLQDAAKKRLHSPIRVPLSASEKPVPQDGGAAWSFHLEPGQARDLYFFLPGGDEHGPSSTVLRPDRIAPAFYAALESEYRTWRAFLATGAQISLPEPGLEDVFNATLVATMVMVDGDEPRGGFTQYEGYWPFAALRQIRLMLDTGHPDYARRYLAEFMRHRIREDGRFWFDVLQQQYQVCDAGDFLAVLSRYYWQTRDPSLFDEFKQPIGWVIAMIRREREASMARFPAGNPRHGMVAGSVENDVPDPDYLYTNNAPLWAGLRDYADALRDLGSRTGNGAVSADGEALAADAAQWHHDLRASFEKYAVVRDSAGRPYFFNIAPNDDGRASRYLTDFKLNNYRRFQCQPRTLATNFLTDDEIRGFYRYQSEHDATILGVRRWRPDILDDFVAFDCDFQRARLGMTREYLMAFFAYLRCLSGNGTWVGFEQSQVRPSAGLLGRAGPPPMPFDFINSCDAEWSTAAIAKMAKDIFAFDEPGGRAVWLACGVSRNWLMGGQPVGAERLGSRFGSIDLSLCYHPNDRAITVDVKAAPDRVIPEVRIRLRDPKEGEKLKSVDDPRVQLIADQDLAVLKDLSGSVRFTANFSP